MENRIYVVALVDDNDFIVYEERFETEAARDHFVYESCVEYLNNSIETGFDADNNGAIYDIDYCKVLA